MLFLIWICRLWSWTSFNFKSFSVQLGLRGIYYPWSDEGYSALYFCKDCSAYKIWEISSSYQQQSQRESLQSHSAVQSGPGQSTERRKESFRQILVTARQGVLLHECIRNVINNETQMFLGALKETLCLPSEQGGQGSATKHLYDTTTILSGLNSTYSAPSGETMVYI